MSRTISWFTADDWEGLYSDEGLLLTEGHSFHPEEPFEYMLQIRPDTILKYELSDTEADEIFGRYGGSFPEFLTDIPNRIIINPTVKMTILGGDYKYEVLKKRA